MKTLRESLNQGMVLLYGYENKHLPDMVKAKTDKVFVYTRNPNNLTSRNYSDIVRKYNSTQDIGWNKADLIFLDNEAIKGMVIGYPSSTPFVLVALDRQRYWLWLIIGIIRRVVNKQVRIQKVIRVKHGQSSRLWMVLKSQNEASGFSISRDVGIEGLLNYLNSENINYVVLRFYQKLPQLYRKGGDLDLLVSDEDQGRVKNFVKKKSGSIRIDIWSVSEPSFNGISCYLPRLAEQILMNSIAGPANSRIPNKKDSMLSLIYHALYHKGINSGIPSTTKKIESIKLPKNDYIAEIQKMAKELNIEIGSTMEELDEYLCKEGWRPKIDTLSKIAQWNEWVKVRFFSDINKRKFPISIFILRQKVISTKSLDTIKKFIKDNEFDILKSTLLTGATRENAILHLRGGTWKDAMFTEETVEFEPAYAMIVVDNHSNSHIRFVNLKNKIREKFDKSPGPSVVHSTDEEVEFWDYVSYCFPDEIDKVEDLVKEALENSKKDAMHLKIFNFIKLLPYYKYTAEAKIKKYIIKIVTT